MVGWYDQQILSRVDGGVTMSMLFIIFIGLLFAYMSGFEEL